MIAFQPYVPANFRNRYQILVDFAFHKTIMRKQKITQTRPAAASHVGAAGISRHYTGPVLHLEVSQERKEKEPVRISLLVNSMYYFLERVMIMKDPSIAGYTLLVIHQKKPLWVKNYKTAKGARIAFKKRFGYKAHIEGLKPDWTKFYSPEGWWVEETLEIVGDGYR